MGRRARRGFSVQRSMGPRASGVGAKSNNNSQYFFFFFFFGGGGVVIVIIVKPTASPFSEY